METTKTKASKAKTTKKVNRTWAAALEYSKIKDYWLTDPKFVDLMNQD